MPAAWRLRHVTFVAVTDRTVASVESMQLQLVADAMDVSPDEHVVQFTDPTATAYVPAAQGVHGPMPL